MDFEVRHMCVKQEIKRLQNDPRSLDRPERRLLTLPVDWTIHRAACHVRRRPGCPAPPNGRLTEPLAQIPLVTSSHLLSADNRKILSKIPDLAPQLPQKRSEEGPSIAVEAIEVGRSSDERLGSIARPFAASAPAMSRRCPLLRPRTWKGLRTC